MATGIRVPLKTQAPLTFPGMLSTAGHCDQSSAATEGFSFRSFYTRSPFVRSGSEKPKRRIPAISEAKGEGAAGLQQDKGQS